MKNKRIFLLPISLLLAFSLASCGSSQKSNNGISGQDNSNNSASSQGLSLNAEALQLYVGKTVTLIATLNGETTSNVTWSSSDTSVATVDGGLVTALKAGTTNITATVDNLTATCVITAVEQEEKDLYVPDYNDSTIYFITDDTLSKGTYDSSKEEYTFSITQNYKQIYVKAPSKTVVIELNGVTIENSANSPIYVSSCEDVEISAKSGTTNNIKDTRAAFLAEDYSQGKGAIFVYDGDLKLKGAGTLNITASYYNGIHGKDDVKVQKQTLNITAINHGIRGNDSVTITSGTINISCGGDGLHSDNSDLSSKGNQKGNVTINGGTLTINSWCDAISAAYNAIVEQTDSSVPLSITIKTNKYSSYDGDVIETSTTNFYLKMKSSVYANGAYTYAAYINGAWYKATYKGTQSSGFGGFNAPPGGGGGPGGTTYYFYQLEKPNGANSFTLYRFQGSNVTTFSTTSYDAVGDAKAFNANYDTVTVDSVSNKKINFSSWSNYSSGNNNSAEKSAKGIKAENEIYIESGTIDIKTYDDAIHANNDGIEELNGLLENGKEPLGNVNISGGTLALYASDDAVHADNQLNISGGQITVSSAYEGLEANVVYVSGGESYVYATDDGINATKGNAAAAIIIAGGYLDVEVPTSGDTDGIDSNGSYTQNGGVVIVKGPGNAGGAAALDTDGAVSLSSCTLIVFGSIEKTPSTSLTKTTSSTTFNAGSHTVSFSNGTSYTSTLKSSSRGCIVYSSLGTATLK